MARVGDHRFTPAATASDGDLSACLCEVVTKKERPRDRNQPHLLFRVTAPQLRTKPDGVSDVCLLVSSIVTGF
ncbi:hypothetical protein L2E82_33562 [Cichorium intybus]|uniref:Uncharacterized protein n=1 Tax=Cichorium intybus TaxID=13427 RepID=A0ACB9BKI5_CICIN|nr:hypothetical protein L2E82_33562 [Cichorium intybus]